METSKTKHNYEEKKQKRGEGNIKKSRRKKEILKRNKLFNNKREGKLTYKETLIHTHKK